MSFDSLAPPIPPIDQVALHAWLDRLASDWNDPRGRLVSRVALLRAHRRTLHAMGWVHQHPWSTYGDEQLIELTEEYLQRRALAEAA